MLRGSALFALLLAGCATLGFGPTPCPAEGGPPWRELTSQHFTLQTDFGEETARAELVELEHLWAGLRRAIGAPDLPTSARQHRVVLLAAEGERHDLLHHWAGIAMHGLLDEGLVLAGDVGVGDGREVLAHELTHELVAELIPRIPRWMNEGLASYFQSLEFKPDPGSDTHELMLVGARPAEPFALRVGIAELFQWGNRQHDPREVSGNYYTSWFLVRDLMDNHAQAFADLQARLRHQTFEVAFAAAFPGVSPRDLDVELANVNAVEVLTYRLPSFVAHKPRSTRVMSDAEVHALRALLYAHVGGPEAPLKAGRELAAALAQEPTNIDALLVQLELAPGDSRLRLARAAAAVAPGDWRAQLSLALALSDVQETKERTAALEAAVDLAPDSGRALAALASERLRSGRSTDALTLAERAVTLEPWNPWPRQMAAAADYHLGRCADAVANQEAVLAMTPPERGPEVDKVNRTRLAKYREECPSPGRPGGTAPESAP